MNTENLMKRIGGINFEYHGKRQPQ